MLVFRFKVILAFYGWSFLLWNFLEYRVIGEYNIKILATNFSPLFLLHCDNQGAKIVTLIFRFFRLLQNCLLWTEMLKLLVKIVELQ